MTTTRYTITDENTGQQAGPLPSLAIEALVGGWFIDAPTEVTDAIAELGERLNRNGRDDWAKAQGLATYLGLSIERDNTPK